MAEDSMTVVVPNGPVGLLPIATNKTYKAKDGNVAQKLALDVTGYTQNEIRKFLVAITAEEMSEQIAIDNPPAFADVDGVRGKGIAYAERSVVMSFGTRLKVQALNDLKAALKQAIDASTVARTGTLSDMSNWEYRYVRNGRVTPLPLTGASGIPMGPQDFIVLVPKSVRNKKGQAYATAANMRVAGSGKLSFKRSARSRPKRGDQSIGYLALTARSAKASAAFGGFNVTANFTTAYHVAGEVTRAGGVRTGYLKISPKTGRR
jgi:hypothetical protein